jgi:hypothetical protein
LIFEEISFLSYEKFSFLSSYNQQSELNLHNARFLKLSFDIIPDSFYSLSLGFLIYNLLILVIGFGSFLPIKSNIKFLFFEKKYCFFSLIYLFNFLFSNLLLNFNLVNTTILTDESVELFLYFIFWSDTKDKIKNVRNIR